MATITGELVASTSQYHDDATNKWVDVESATSDKLRKTWALTAGQKYRRVHVIGTTMNIFPEFTQKDTIEVQTVVNKDPTYGFLGMFYYKVS